MEKGGFEETCLQNIIDLHEESNFLLQHKRWRRGFFLALTAHEEAFKLGKFILEGAQSSKMWDHKNKFVQIKNYGDWLYEEIKRDFISKDPENEKQIIDAMEKYRKHHENMYNGHWLRMRALYVDEKFLEEFKGLETTANRLISPLLSALNKDIQFLHSELKKRRDA